MSAFALQDPTAFLSEPALGESALKHNESFTEFNGIYKDVVSEINKFIRMLRDVGATFLHEIPWEDLYQELVVPLAGDYGKIGQNGDACTKLASGMHAWAGNVDRLNRGADQVWDGRAAEAFGSQMLQYQLVMDGVGATMRLGTFVFKGVGRISEKLGVLVENVIVKGAELIWKVSKKVAAKVSGWFGWASLVYDMATNGFEYFRDLYEDIETCVSLIQNCFDLKDHVEDWANAEKERFAAFKKLPAIMAKLPDVTAHDLATGTVDPTLKQDLEDLRDAITGARSDEALAQIKEDIAALAGDTGQDSPDIQDPMTEGADPPPVTTPPRPVADPGSRSFGPR